MIGVIDLGVLLTWLRSSLAFSIMATVTLFVYNARQRGLVEYVADWEAETDSGGTIRVDKDDIAEWVWDLGWTGESMFEAPDIGPPTAKNVCAWLKRGIADPKSYARTYRLTEAIGRTVFLGDNLLGDWLEAIEDRAVEIVLDEASSALF